ncbi:mutator family transposase [Streptomyces sp. KS 21]|nr:mutator family transposase [Streptomyces sp. KS 21]
MLSVVNDDGSTTTGSLSDDIVREGARRMLAVALEAEVDQYIAELAGQKDERGRRLVVRNGHHRPRHVTTAAGAIEVTAPRPCGPMASTPRSASDRPTPASWSSWASGPTGARSSWRSPRACASLLRDCRRRGMRDPALVAGDGAIGLWNALAEVFSAARHQRCWVHKTRNVMNALPKPAQPGAKKALQEIHNAEDREHAAKVVKDFARTYGAKWPKAAKKITDDEDELLAFYDFPAEHWIHLRTTTPIESTFSTVKLRTKVTRGAGSAAAALAMVFKLAESAQERWRAITAHPTSSPASAPVTASGTATSSNAPRPTPHDHGARMCR